MVNITVKLSLKYSVKSHVISPVSFCCEKLVNHVFNLFPRTIHNKSLLRNFFYNDPEC